ncbi:enkurin [Odontomachus brunneus]|uniref:enkurin n=1 Tax=Odontomachus brunneus TaxID=486640 RepID=UPI0013F252B4|nr:enkurin [Odontomachus brunneus]
MADFPEKLAVARGKDFVKQNILRVKSSSPKEPKQRSVDTRYGDTRDLKNSGLLPTYVHKKNYGKIPKFVALGTRASVSVETETTRHRDLDEDKMPVIPLCRYVDKEERKMLLDGMKEKWESLMKQFQRLPLTITLAHVQRKARLERELQQLEKDIAIVERHPHMYVYGTDDT